MPWASSSARCSSYSSRPSHINLRIWATAARASWFDGACVRRVLSGRLRWGREAPELLGLEIVVASLL
eukprot:1231894-Rhodomonas_salina.1